MKLAPVDARPSAWGNPDGTQSPIVRLHAGRTTIAVSYDDLPKLLAELAQLQYEHQKTTRREPTECT